MNILFVSAVFPFPLHSGGQIRMYNLLKRLSLKHNITLVSFIRNDDEMAFIKELHFCREVHVVKRGRALQPRYVQKALFGKYPWLLATYDNPKMYQLLQNLIGSSHIDLIHLEPFYVWPSIPKTKLPIVISEHNIEYDVYDQYTRLHASFFLRPFLRRDVAKIRYWEHLAWRTVDKVTTVSSLDATIIQKYLSHAISVVSNGVDLSTFPFSITSIEKNILFVGNFRWLANRDAAVFLVDRIWPHIAKKFPDATLTVVGRDMPVFLQHKIHKISGLALDQVEDILPLYKKANVLVAPHGIAGGSKFKILEAFASGLPVVTTKAGASGIEARADFHYLEAATSDEFVQQIGSLFDHYELAKKIARQARSLVESQYDWGSIATVLHDVWKEAYERK